MQYHAEYVSFISEIIEKGYARKVSAEELLPEEGKVWYLPHHGVYHHKKPNSLRVGLDCSARFQGELLNDLLQGPDLSSKRTGGLTSQCAKERKALLKKTSSLNTRDPYPDVTGVLRAGGRITKANLTDSLKNPVILPKTGDIEELIIRHIHERTHHSRMGVTLNELC